MLMTAERLQALAETNQWLYFEARTVVGHLSESRHVQYFDP